MDSERTRQDDPDLATVPSSLAETFAVREREPQRRRSADPDYAPRG